jgi:hypothetical protein
MYTWYYNHVTSSNYYVGSDLKKGIQDTPAPRYVVGKAGLSWNDNMIKDLRAAATDGAEQISGWAPSSAPLAAGTLLSYGSRCRIAAPMNVLQTKSTNPNVIINYPISIDHTPVYQVRTDGADQTFSVNVGEPTCDANGGPATDCDAVVYQPVTYDLNVDVTGAGTWKLCQVYDSTCDGVYETQASGSDTTVFFHFYRATPPGANIRIQVANLRTSYQPPDGETRIVLNIEDPVTGAPLRPINVSTASTGPSIIVCQVASQPGCAAGGSTLVKTDGFTVTDPDALGSQQTYTYQAPVISAVSVPQ